MCGNVRQFLARARDHPGKNAFLSSVFTEAKESLRCKWSLCYLHAHHAKQCTVHGVSTARRPRRIFRGPTCPKSMQQTQLGVIDYITLALYVAFVVGIGFALKRYLKSSSDFLTSGRSIPAWVTGLA